MPFTWIHSMLVDKNVNVGCLSHGTPQIPSPYGKGGIEIQEVRDNADWLKDNIVCQYHNSADNATYDASVNASDRDVHQSIFNNAEDVTNNPGHLATALSGNLAIANTAQDLTAYGTNNASYNKANDTVQYGTEYSLNYNFDDVGHNVLAKSSHDLSVESIYCSANTP